MVGGGNGVAEKAAKNLKNKYPGCRAQLLGNSSFSFRQRFNEELLLNFPEELPLSSILFVALGPVKQEKWINENLDKMPWVKIAMGVGGAFDFLAGRIKRPPKVFQRLGLEWLWRLALQPWRIKRIFKSVFMFPWLVIKDTILSKTK